MLSIITNVTPNLVRNDEYRTKGNEHKLRK